MLFPWATGNLRRFWQSHSPPERTVSMVRWIAKQCEGIAQGLRKIHRNDSDTFRNGGHERDDVGIHSDIKPENILWFEDSKGKGHGTLVICDFGFTRFHRQQSRSVAYIAGGSDTYRAPEIDFSNRASRAYDVWSLACLYLEFITWYLMGFDSVELDFTNARLAGDERSFGFEADKFFNHYNFTANLEANNGAVIKPAVLEVRNTPSPPPPKPRLEATTWY